MSADPRDVLRDHIRACTLCTARADAREPVPFAFPLAARTGSPPVLVVGRNPGREEDETGMPFVGRSGRLLNEFLVNAGLDREADCVVTNNVKCYTHANREPLRHEVATCRRYLFAEIQLFQPRLVIGLGAQVCMTLIGQPLKSVSGTVRESPGKAATFFTLHPSAVLRTPSSKNRWWADSETLRRWVEANLRATAPDPSPLEAPA